MTLLGLVTDATYPRLFFSVPLAWIRLQGKTIDIVEAARHGRRLASICRQAGIEPGHVSDPRFGVVLTYPETILESYFGPPVRMP